MVTGLRQPADVPADSPEGVVQRYLRAVADDNRREISATYAPALRQRCDSDDSGFTPQFPNEGMSFEADLVAVREAVQGTVEVQVRITELSGSPPFGGIDYDHTEVFVVERSGEGWGLAETAWPHSMYSACAP